MESKLQQPYYLWHLAPIFILLLISNLQNRANAEPQVPCYFIFGDSLSDNGNNNDLNTQAKVNYRPYGIDFPGGPTGRFCNGENMQDFIVTHLGFKEYIVAYAKANGKSILRGVNYASGSAGILDESGKQLGERIPMKEQIRNHKIIISRIRSILGSDSSTKKLISQCIYSIQIGSNDYINNYFKPEFYDSSRQYTPDQFAALLVEQLLLQIKSLDGHGARKFAIYGLGLIGCTPDAIRVYGTNGSQCVDKLNNAATLFNTKLMPRIMELNTNLSNAKFTFLNPAPSPADLLQFAVSNAPCCKTGGGGGELCIRNSRLCNSTERSQYVFWDGVHTSKAWNKALAKSAYQTNSTTEANPFNIKNLAKQQVSINN